mmetsp:Transcript_73956/g.85847  ORF Transcript_73956/g.85847 Transcript_73956/m.85847 type:complete len:149 (-) Transcript_73956:106-552(-)
MAEKNQDEKLRYFEKQIDEQVKQMLRNNKRFLESLACSENMAEEEARALALESSAQSFLTAGQNLLKIILEMKIHVLQNLDSKKLLQTMDVESQRNSRDVLSEKIVKALDAIQIFEEKIAPINVKPVVADYEFIADRNDQDSGYNFLA